MMPILYANIGQHNTIQKISGNSEIKKHLADLGFVPGSDVTLLTNASGNVIVDIKDARIALDKGMAQKIMI